MEHAWVKPLIISVKEGKSGTVLYDPITRLRLIITCLAVMSKTSEDPQHCSKL